MTPKFSVGDFVFCDDGWTLGCASGWIKRVEPDRDTFLYYIDGVKLGHGISECEIFWTKAEALAYVKKNYDESTAELNKAMNGFYDKKNEWN